MRSTLPFAALVAFALINTAFLGVYIYSSSSTVASSTSTTGTLNSELTGAQSALSSTASTAPTTTVTSTSTVANTATNTAATTQYTSTTTIATASGTSTTASQAATTSTASVTTTASSGPTYTLTTASTNKSAGSGNLGQLSVPSSTTTTSTSTTAGAGYALGSSVTSLSSASLSVSVAKFFEQHSIELAPASWFAVGGMWIWRGRMRSKWTDLGFDSDVFGLFVKMKGAKTRIRLLDALSVPKDRLQLAEELGLDWKSVDRHVAVMKKYGFVDDKLAYGRVRMYQLTPMGVSLLKLLQELSREEKRDAGPPTAVAQGET